MQPYAVVQEPSRDSLFTNFGKQTLSDRYLLPGETYQGLFARVAGRYGADQGHAQRIYDYMSKHWFMAATPVLANGGTDRGLPVSCFVNEPTDDMQGIEGTLSENFWLAAKGGGIGTYWGNIRSIGEKIRTGKTSGVIPFIVVMDSMSMAVSQGCVDGDTEILTEKGWVAFSELGKEHGKVYQVNDDGSGEFVDVLEYHEYDHDGDMYHFGNPGRTVSHLVTPNHRMIYQATSIKQVDGKRVRGWAPALRERQAEDFKPHRDNRLFVSAGHVVSGTDKDALTPKERLLIAYQADGQKSPSGNSNGAKSGDVRYTFHFTKQRKVDRLVEILEKVGYRYTVSQFKDGTHNIAVMFPLGSTPPRTLDMWVNDIPSRSREWCLAFIKEAIHWDGSPGFGTFEEWSSAQYSTTEKANADTISAIGTMAGLKTLVRYNPRENYGNRSPIYTVHFLEDRATIGGENITKTKQKFSGKVYCVSVPSGRFMARKDGAPIVTGNSLRRGSGAAYLPVSHPEVEEFCEMRRPTGGDPARKARALHHGVCITDDFMEAVKAGKDWAFKSPKTGETIRTVPARDLWIRLLTARIEQGEPYLLFTDTVNKAMPSFQKEAGLKVKTSNLCSEITLPTGLDQYNKERTAVCCLSSLNIEKWEEWKDEPGFIKDVLLFLDNVLQDFIDNAPDFMSRATYSAMRERAVGLGAMGLHSFFQSKSIPFGSVMAKVWNKKIFQYIHDEAEKANVELAEERGSCPDAADKGAKARFACKTSIAPTASISVIAGTTSAGIDPISANEFTQKTLAGSFSVRNRHLQVLLEKHGENTDERWADIALHKGSVQHLPFLTDDEKEVFKTAFEIDQRWVVELAADRAPLIDQAQSVNLFLPGDVSKKEMHQLHFSAWEKGVKSLYYCRSLAVSRSGTHARDVSSDNVAPVTGEAEEDRYETCISCQ